MKVVRNELGIDLVINHFVVETEYTASEGNKKFILTLVDPNYLPQDGTPAYNHYISFCGAMDSAPGF